MAPDGRIRRAAIGWLGGAVLGGRGSAQPRVPRPVPVAPPRTAQEPQPDGAAEHTEVTALGSAPADPYRRLPPGMAKLLVQRARGADGEPAYLVTGTADGDSHLPAARPHRPPHGLRLARLRRDPAAEDGSAPGFPSEFYRAARHWSRQPPQRALADWLNDLRARHGDALHLVVWDDTDFEIPWELLSLDDSPPRTGPGPAGGPEPLGALVPVTRWTSSCEQGRPLLGDGKDCSGGVLSYFDHAMRRDQDAFRHTAHEPYTDPDDFLTALGGADRSPGLVYMGCHGTHGSDLEHLRLDNLSWYEVAERPLHALAGGRTAVVLNVCHSGRLVRNHDGGEDELRGFCELFLREGAAACVATRGEVSDTAARELLAHLVEHTRRTPGRPLAAMLRDFRARALVALPDPVPRTRGRDRAVDNDGQRRVLHYLYAFMYVYYGHPHTTLRLAPNAPNAPDGAA